MNSQSFTRLGVLVLLCVGAGCATYATPGRGAKMTALGAPPPKAEYGPGTDSSIREAFDKQPLAKFPAAIAVARVQAPGYHSRTNTGWGVGEYCVVTTRDIEQPDQIARLNKLPMVRGIAPLNRLLINGPLISDLPLRQAAAQLQADLLLVYTLDTVFNTEDKAIPLSVISLGFSPNKQLRVTSTASALLLDTRNGYVYGLAEATERKNQLTNAWQNEVAIDETRRETESSAFEKLVGELETTWQGVLLNQVTNSLAVAASGGKG